MSCCASRKNGARISSDSVFDAAIPLILFWLRSTVRRVLRDALCPVLTVSTSG